MALRATIELGRRSDVKGATGDVRFLFLCFDGRFLKDLLTIL
jgi:hypothetical protein